jgi:hypothetical protein
LAGESSLDFSSPSYSFLRNPYENFSGQFSQPRNCPRLAAGKPETRQYKAVCFTGKSEIGLTRAVVVAIAAP